MLGSLFFMGIILERRDFMFYKKFNDKYIIRLEIGEEIFESLQKLIAEENIKLARITGIGACDYAEVGMYVVSKKDYRKTILEGDMEILSLDGNISERDGNPHIHIHAVLEDMNHEIKGGHLDKAIISATCEIILDVIDGSITRKFDEQSGLYVLDI